MSRWSVALGTAGFVLSAAGSGTAQHVRPAWPADDAGRSPLHMPAHVPRGEHFALTQTVLTSAEPRSGLFWFSGNPGALPLEVTRSFSEARASYASRSGTYRRPLDTEAADLVEVLGHGWRPLGSRGAGVGGVSFTRESQQPGSFAHLLSPYSSSPLIPVDTSQPPVRRTGARLEAAGGWLLRGVGLGIAAGYDVVDNITESTPLPRLGRYAAPGVAVGVARPFRAADVAVGVRARASQQRETINIVPRASFGQVYHVIGFGEPEAAAIEPGFPYYRRLERDGRALGASASARLLGASWAVVAELESLEERQFSQRSNQPAEDRWSATGFSAGVDAHLRGGQGLLQVSMRAREIEGLAQRSDLSGAVLRRRQTHLTASAQGLVRDRLAMTEAGARLLVARDTRHDNDILERMESDLRSWTAAVEAYASRAHVGPLTIGARVAAGHYSPSGQIPSVDTRGPIYRRFVAPELALAMSTAKMYSGGVHILHATGPADFWAEVSYSRTSPGASGQPLMPGGARAFWSIGGGVGRKRRP